MKKTYVSVGNPLEFHKFEENNAPIGWKRIDLLKEKLKRDSEYRKKFTEYELKQISEAK